MLEKRNSLKSFMLPMMYALSFNLTLKITNVAFFNMWS